MKEEVVPQQTSEIRVQLEHNVAMVVRTAYEGIQAH